VPRGVRLFRYVLCLRCARYFARAHEEGAALRRLTTVLSLLAFASCAYADSTDSSHATRPPADALAIFRGMSDFLAAQPRFSFRAEVSYDVLQETGEKLEFGSERSFLVRRPDRVLVAARGRDGVEERLTFDGTTLTVAVPDEGVYASVEHPGNTEAAVDFLVDEMGVMSPLGDLLHPRLADEVASRIESSRVVGTASIRGVRCHHLAFSRSGVGFQIWVEQGERPVPVRIVVTYRDHEGSPQFSAGLAGWDFAPDVPDSAFAFAPTEAAKRVPFFELKRRIALAREGI